MSPVANLILVYANQTFHRNDWALPSRGISPNTPCCAFRPNMMALQFAMSIQKHNLGKNHVFQREDWILSHKTQANYRIMRLSSGRLTRFKLPLPGSPTKTRDQRPRQVQLQPSWALLNGIAVASKNRRQGDAAHIWPTIELCPYFVQPVFMKIFLECFLLSRRQICCLTKTNESTMCYSDQ